MSGKDIDELCMRWNEAKKQITKLEEKCEKYKNYCEKLMDKQGSDEIMTSKFTVKRRHITRYNVSTKDLPADIRQKYSTKCNFSTLFLKEL